MSLRLTPRTSPRTRRAERRECRPRPDSAATGPLAEVARHRRAGGPEDTALYACACGMGFRADVSASVDCPRCGAAQDW